MHQPRSSFHVSNNRASGYFWTHTPWFMRPYRTWSSCCAFYVLTIVVVFSRCVLIYLSYNKLEVKTIFLNIVALVDKQFSQTIKRIRSNNDTEFNCLRPYFFKHGMVFETSCVTPPQKMALWNKNINIFLMLPGFWDSKLTWLWSFRGIVS